MRQSLRNDDAGRYLITTATGSEHLVDLTARTIRRQAGAVAPRSDFAEEEISRLRRDGEELKLLVLETCDVGTSASFWINVREDNLPTLRTTSPVVCIQALPEADV